MARRISHPLFVLVKVGLKGQIAISPGQRPGEMNDVRLVRPVRAKALFFNRLARIFHHIQFYRALRNPDIHLGMLSSDDALFDASHSLMFEALPIRSLKRRHNRLAKRNVYIPCLTSLSIDCCSFSLLPQDGRRFRFLTTDRERERDRKRLQHEWHGNQLN